MLSNLRLYQTQPFLCRHRENLQVPKKLVATILINICRHAFLSVFRALFLRAAEKGGRALL